MKTGIRYEKICVSWVCQCVKSLFCNTQYLELLTEDPRQKRDAFLAFTSLLHTTHTSCPWACTLLSPSHSCGFSPTLSLFSTKASCQGVFDVSLGELPTATMARSLASSPSSGMRACQRRYGGLAVAGEAPGETTPPPYFLSLSHLSLSQVQRRRGRRSKRRVPAGTTPDSSRSSLAAILLSPPVGFLSMSFALLSNNGCSGEEEATS